MGCCGSREAEKEAGKGTATKEKPAAGAPAAEEDPVEKAIKESFGKYDKDGNGEISSSDIAAVLKDAGMSLSKPQEIVLKKNPVVTASPVLKLEEVLKVYRTVKKTGAAKIGGGGGGMGGLAAKAGEAAKKKEENKA